MRLPFRRTRVTVLRICSAVLFAVVVALAIPNAAHAWHGDGGWHHGHGHWHHGGWGWGHHWYGTAFVPAPFFVPPPPVYPSYYPAPVYAAPYYPAPPVYIPGPPTVTFGFVFGR